MKYQFLFVFGALGLIVAGCRNSDSQNTIVSQRYIHKYGYAVSKEEWESRNYPGQVITNLRDGVTITATYENGVLHGPSTRTYQHSQTVESYYLYNQGSQVKEILYDIKGMPMRETVQLSPSRYSMTLWYVDGTPLSLEEYAGEELLEAQYFTIQNEVEARVEKGNGVRVRRNREGLLISKEQIQAGSTVRRETFFPNGAPESISTYSNGKLHGEKKLFAQSGEPLLVEEWVNGQLHGKSTYFKNGTRYLEITYLNGLKNGSEVHYLDGELVSLEIQWEEDKKHGPSTYYIDGGTRQEWYYDGRHVTQRDYDTLLKRDEMVSHISEELKWDVSR